MEGKLLKDYDYTKSLTYLQVNIGKNARNKSINQFNTPNPPKPQSPFSDPQKTDLLQW